MSSRPSFVILDADQGAGAALRRLQAVDKPVWALIWRRLPRAEWFAMRASAVTYRLADADDQATLSALLDLDEQHPATVSRLDRGDIAAGVCMVGTTVVDFVPTAIAMGQVSTHQPPAGDPSDRPDRQAPGRTIAADVVIEAPATAEPGGSFDLAIDLAEAAGTPDVVVAGIAPDTTELRLDLIVTTRLVAVPVLPFILVDLGSGESQPATYTVTVPAGMKPGVERIEIQLYERGVPVGSAWHEVAIGLDDVEITQGSTAVTLVSDPPDLTIEVSRPAANPASAELTITVASRHLGGSGVSVPMTVSDGDDLRTFALRVRAKAQRSSTGALTDETFLGIGKTIGGVIPPEVWTALADIRRTVDSSRSPLSALLITDDPYLPWEVAVLPEPIEPDRAPFLGAQLSLGRWTRAAGMPEKRTAPLEQISVIIGSYTEPYEALPMADKEAEELTTEHGAAHIDATTTAVNELLNGQAGHVGVIHFSGHGGTRRDDQEVTHLVLEDGTLDEFVLAGAGAAESGDVSLFFNACMAGFGHESLGVVAGMAGTAIGAGFRWFVAPTWGVTDGLAYDVATLFYRNVGTGKTVGEFFADVRQRFLTADGKSSNAGNLAYVYYGHPDSVLSWQ